MCAARVSQQGYAPRAWSVEHDVDWQAIEVSLVPPLVRNALGHMYMHVLAAERLGLRLVTALIEAAPEGVLRDAARAQFEEEKKHIALFERLGAVLGAEAELSLNLALLERELTNSRDYRSLMLQTQVLESTAHALFVGNGRQSLRSLGRGIRLPGTAVIEIMVRLVTNLVGADEARHVAFGMRALRSQFVGISPRELHVAEAQVQESCALMQSVVAELEGCFRVLGFARGEVGERVALSQQRYFRHLGITIDAVGFGTGG